MVGEESGRHLLWERGCAAKEPATQTQDWVVAGAKNNRESTQLDQTDPHDVTGGVCQ